MENFQPWMLVPLIICTVSVLVIRYVLIPHYRIVFEATGAVLRAVGTWWQTGARRAEEQAEAKHRARMVRLGVNGFEGDYVEDEPAALRPSELSELSVLGRTEDQAPPVMPAPAYTREQLLTLYRLMRAHGVSRERARPVLKEAGIPLSNDVWAAAAPPEQEPEYVTPIAGRPTNAKYYDDPELEYQAPGV